MKCYSWSKEDFRELLIHKYNQMEEKRWCLGDWAENTDYVLCNGDSDLLPTLVKKDEIRYEYNQYKYSWSYVSCTIFAAVWMASDLTNYKFSYDEIKEIDDLSYDNPKYPHVRKRWEGWYVKYAVDLVQTRWNEHPELVKTYGKLAYYRLDKFSDEIIESTLDKLYTIDWNYCPTKKYNEDKLDLMIDWKDFGYSTNWHSVDVIKKQGQRSVKDSGSVPSKNIYWLKHKLSEITNYWQYFYVYVIVNDWEQEIKRLNEMKSKVVQAIDLNSQLWHLANDTNYKNLLHEMNEANRKKLEDINQELQKYV
jgi:hypothetical protein